MKHGDILDQTESEYFPELMDHVLENAPKILKKETSNHALFKTKVGGSGKVTISTVERNITGIEEGEIVHLIVEPLDGDE